MQLSLQVSSVSKPEALTNDDYCSKFARIIMQRPNDYLLILCSNNYFIENSSGLLYRVV